MKKNVTMDIQTLKLELVNKIIHTDKESVLIKINKIFKSEISDDWWDILPQEVKDSILEGMRDVQEGNLFAHEQVIQEARNKYGF